MTKMLNFHSWRTNNLKNNYGGNEIHVTLLETLDTGGLHGHNHVVDG